MLAQRTKLITPPSTSKMRVIANELKESGVHVINFAAGELDVDTSELIKNAAKEAINNKCNTYTPALGLKQLRESIAAHVSMKCNTTYTASEVGVTAGAKQALFNTAMVLLNEGDEVIIPQPYWVTFPTQVEIAGAKPVFIDTKKTGYRLQFEAVKNAITSATKAIILNTPNNPTGVVYDSNVIRKIAEIALEKNIWIIFDECYSELIRQPHTHVNIVEVFPPAKKRTILINSFSKSHALTGWRIGYVCGPSEVIKAMENLQGHTTSNPCSISQYAVNAALHNDHSEFQGNINQVLSERLHRALTIVDTMNNVSYAPPEGAFYLFLNIEQKLNKYYGKHFIADVGALCELILSEARVAVVPGDAFGDPSGIRISYAIGTDDVVEGMQRLAGFFNSIK